MATDNHSQQFNEAARGRRSGLMEEFWSFVKYQKKWWLLPLLVVLLGLGALVILSGSAAAPFIYTLF